MQTLIRDPFFRKFLFRFLLVFALGYYGTQFLIGLAAPGGWYSPFYHQYLDYISWMRRALLWGGKVLLMPFGIETYITPDFHLRYVGGRGVYLAYDCVGYGVMFFWLALVVALPGKFKAKLIWVLGGMILLYLINVVRIAMFLVVTNKQTTMPLGLDHHTWFNIVAYSAIFILLYFFYRSGKTD